MLCPLSRLTVAAGTHTAFTHYWTVGRILPAHRFSIFVLLFVNFLCGFTWVCYSRVFERGLNKSTKYLRVVLASDCNKLGNGETYSGEILHTDPCCTFVTRVLGVILIGVIIGKKTYFLKTLFRPCSLPLQAKCRSRTMRCTMDGGVAYLGL